MILFLSELIATCCKDKRELSCSEILIKPDCLLELAKSVTHPGAVLHIKHGRVWSPCGGQSRREVLGRTPKCVKGIIVCEVVQKGCTQEGCAQPADA